MASETAGQAASFSEQNAEIRARFWHAVPARFCTLFIPITAHPPGEEAPMGLSEITAIFD